MSGEPQGKEYEAVVVRLIGEAASARILDAPSGNGWLSRSLPPNRSMVIDGIDLFEGAPAGYGDFWQADLDEPLPAPTGAYDAFVSCEGIEHVGNPLLLMREANRVLRPGGLAIVSTPNIWGPASKLKFLTRGFFPGFPSIAHRIQRGTHMHITPFSFPWLYTYFKLAGFEHVRLHETQRKKGIRSFERPFRWIQRQYCQKKTMTSETEEERLYWQDAATDQSIYGRQLVVSAVKPA